MKKPFIRIGLSALLWSGLVDTACAQNQVFVSGLGPNQILHFVSPTNDFSYVGEFLFNIITPSGTLSNLPSWCVDFFHPINYAFTDSLTPPSGSTFLEVSYLAHNFELLPGSATNDVAAAATQLAMWRLIHSNFTFTADADASAAGNLPAVLGLANTLAAQAVGKRPLMGTSNVFFDVVTSQGIGNLVNVLVTLTEGGQPVVGENVILTTSAGSFVSPGSGNPVTGVTDSNGLIQATVNLGTNSLPVTVSAAATATPMYIVQSASSGDQALLSMIGEVPFTASDVLNKPPWLPPCDKDKDKDHQGGCDKDKSSCNDKDVSHQGGCNDSKSGSKPFDFWGFFKSCTPGFSFGGSCKR